MKNKIRQILREETSGFNEKTLKVLYQFMNDLTKDYVWYYDTPEQPFEITPGSIWLINPNTKQWMLELEKSGTLWYYHKLDSNFRKYFNMNRSDFESFIKLWVKDTLKKSVSATFHYEDVSKYKVEDVIKKGVSVVWEKGPFPFWWVEDTIKKGKELR